jgi:hypothetical protein
MTTSELAMDNTKAVRERVRDGETLEMQRWGEELRFGAAQGT